MFWFLSLINRKYLRTVYDTRTGKQFLCDVFLNAKTDKDRFYIFGKHASYYKSIEPEIKEWLKENWERWDNEGGDEDNKVGSTLKLFHEFQKSFYQLPC